MGAAAPGRTPLRLCSKNLGAKVLRVLGFTLVCWMNLGFLSIGCQIYSGWQADVTRCHFLHACMWSQTFSPSPSTHLGDLPQIVDLVMLMCRSCCQGQYLLVHMEWTPIDCLLVFSLLLGAPGTSPCQGLVDVHTKRLAVLEFPRSQTSVLNSECVRCLGTGPPWGAAQELPWGFGVPTP